MSDVSVPLTLGLPKSRDRHGLTDELLLPASSALSTQPASHIGPRVVSAPDWRADGDSVIVALDAQSDAPPVDGGIVGYHLDIAPDQLRDVLSLDLPAPLTIFASDLDPEVTRVITAAGHSAGIAASAPIDQFADFLAVVAHTDAGFVARAADATEIVTVLAATVAALRGNDIRAAITNPDIAPVLALSPEAGAAVREVLQGIVIDDPNAVTAELYELGLLT